MKEANTMAIQALTAPKRIATTKATATKTARPAQGKKTTAASANGNSTAASRPRTKPTSEMTLEELSLRAYKMTYDRLHGSKSKKTIKSTTVKQSK